MRERITHSKVWHKKDMVFKKHLQAWVLCSAWDVIDFHTGKKCALVLFHLTCALQLDPMSLPMDLSLGLGVYFDIVICKQMDIIVSKQTLVGLLSIKSIHLRRFHCRMRDFVVNVLLYLQFKKVLHWALNLCLNALLNWGL